MEYFYSLVFVSFLCLQSTLSQEVPCIIDLECEECLPDNLPMVTSHQFAGSKLTIASGEKVTFNCHKTKFFVYPSKNKIQAFCENDRYRIMDDTSIRHLAELGCQSNYYEDISHHVEGCASPYQGRSYQYQDSNLFTTRHLAEVCFDQDNAKTIFVHTTTATGNNIPQGIHTDQDSPLSLIGTFNTMLDSGTKIEADKLYHNDDSLNKRVYELFKHNNFNFNGQTIAATKLLSPELYKDQNKMVTNFPSNKIAVWRNIVHGNLNNIHKDIKYLVQNTSPEVTHFEIYAGTHQVLTLGTGNDEVYLKPNQRFPVPKYVWTVVLDKTNHKGVALITYNSPFVTILGLRDMLLCKSRCSHINWLKELRNGNSFEMAVYGLVFCCNVHEFAKKVPEMPSGVLGQIHVTEDGLLKDIPVGK